MIEPLNRPTRLLRFVAGLARWSLGCLLALWLLLAVAWGALHGWIVPRIGEFRPQLEAQAARALGLPVRIGAISARSEGLIPTIELLDVALLDARKLERPTTVFVEITLAGQADELLEAFERAVRTIPDVLECHLMAGSADYLLKVVARDTDDFARIHRQRLAKLPGVAQMHSSFSLRTVAFTTALPV